jgi:hypothetical protein
VEGQRKLWIVIGVLATIIVAAGGSCCVLMAWVIASQPQVEVDEESARREGEMDGRAGTTDACLQAGYERTNPCSSVNFDCMNEARTYLLACLDAVLEPSPTLCLGAPASPGLVPDQTFAADLCGRYGWGDTDGCYDVAGTVETHCASNARVERPSPENGSRIEP